MTKFFEHFFTINFFYMPIHEGKRLKFFVERSHKSIVQIVQEMGTARTTLYNYFELEQIQRKKLLPILEILGVEEVKFFKQAVEEDEVEYQVLKQKVEGLERELAAKDEIIQQQKDMIELLKNKKK